MQHAIIPRLNPDSIPATTTTPWGPQHNDYIDALLVKHLREVVATSSDEKGEDERICQLKSLLEAARDRIAPSDPTANDDNKAVITLPPPTHATLSSIHHLINGLVSRLVDKEGTTTTTTTTTSAIDFNTLLHLAELKEVETHTLTTALSSLLERTREASSGQCVVRVMEVIEGGGHLVVDELSSRDDAIPAGVTIEYFISSHSTDLLKSLSVRTIKRPSSLRLRYIAISAGAARLDLDDMTMDVVIANDWLREGVAGWSSSGSSEAEAVSAMMTKLSPHLAPKAQFIIRGFGQRPVWPALLSHLAGEGEPSLGTTSLPLVEDIDITKGLAATKNAMAKYCHISSCVGSSLLCPALLGQYMDKTQTSSSSSAGHIIVITDTAQRAESFQQEVVSKRPSTHLSIISIGQVEEFGDGYDMEGIKQKIQDAVDDGTTNQQHQLTSIVFLGGINDYSPTGDVAFQRLLYTSQALDALGPYLEKQQEQSKANIDGTTTCTTSVEFWVVTEGVYGGKKIRPEQASLQGFFTALHRELNSTIYTIKLVDLSDASADLNVLADLVVNHRPERTYSVDQGVLKVPRYHIVDKDAALSVEVKANDPTLRYVAEVDSEYRAVGLSERFVIEEILAPADDEVQVDIRASGVNFRDVMVSKQAINKWIASYVLLLLLQFYNSHTHGIYFS